MKRFLPAVSFVLVLFIVILPSKALALTGPEDPYSFSATSGSAPGTVTIRWYDDQTADQYNLLYGTDPSHYNYGVVKLPDAANTTNTFTINYLTPGQTYYFTLIGMKGTSPNYSGPVAAVATAQNASPQITSHLPEYGFSAVTGSAPGTVQLSWTDNGSAEKYDIVYGATPQANQYGAENIPFNPNMNNSYTVGALASGETYYFSLVAEKNGSIVLWSSPIRAVAR
jgi:Fibronectin type III domain